VFLGDVVKIKSIFVIVLKMLIGISGAVTDDGLKTSSLGDYAKKCQQQGLSIILNAQR
jgi:hypothetical protein